MFHLAATSLPRPSLGLTALLLAVLLAACGDDPVGGGLDASTDAGTDAGIETDTDTDAGPVDDGVLPVTPPVPGDTDPESSAPTAIISGTPFEITLSDGTRFALDIDSGNAAGTPLTEVTLERASNDVDLSDLGVETTGAMRVVTFETFDPVALGLLAGSIVPTLTIPAAEVGDIDPATLTVARIADVALEGEAVEGAVAWLDVRRADNGDLLVADPWFPDSIAAALAEEQRGADKQITGPPIHPRRIRYVAATTQGHVNWRRPPQLVRMVVDPDAGAMRRPLDSLDDDEREIEQRRCVTDVVVLVHGHNERERGGFFGDAIDVDAPWFFSYKRDVWTPLFEYFGTTSYIDQIGCTAFYEFIYPSYRPIFTPTAGAERLDEAFARLLLAELEPKLYPGSGLRLHVVAHSMGGLVSRAGIQLMDSRLQEAFESLITWGSPHLGGALVSLRYVLGAAPPYDVRSGLVALPTANTDEMLTAVRRAVDGLQMDTPGTRDLRWANSHTTTPRPLAFDRLWENSPAQVAAESAREVPEAHFDLIDGPWLFNENLRRLNTSDLHGLSERYRFMYGITSKRPTIAYDYWFLPRLEGGEIALGALVTDWFVGNPTEVVLGHPQNRGDGAVSIASMAGLGVATTTLEIGDVDHEEYFGAPTAPGQFSRDVLARSTAEKTAQQGRYYELGARCPELQVEPPADDGAGALVLTGALVWPGDEEPGERIEALRVRPDPDVLDADVPLRDVAVQPDGTFEGAMPNHVVFVDPEAPTVVARLVDGTELVAEASIASETYHVDVAVSAEYPWLNLTVAGTVSFDMDAAGIVFEGTDDFAGHPSYEFNVRPGSPVTWTATVDVALSTSEYIETSSGGIITEHYYHSPELLYVGPPVDLGRLEGGTISIAGMRMDASFTLDPAEDANQFYVPIIVEFTEDRIYRYTDGTVDEWPAVDKHRAWLVDFDVDIF